MDELEMLRRYGARSAKLSVPPVDVTADALDSIRRDPRGADRRTANLRPLWSVAAACWVVAISLALVAGQSWAEAQDPFDALVAPFVVSLQ